MFFVKNCFWPAAHYMLIEQPSCGRYDILHSTGKQNEVLSTKVFCTVLHSLEVETQSQIQWQRATGSQTRRARELSPAGLRVEWLLPTGTFTPCGWFCSTTWTCWAFSSECRTGHHRVPGAMNQVTVSSGGPITPKGLFLTYSLQVAKPGNEWLLVISVICPKNILSSITDVQVTSSKLRFVVVHR